MKVLVYGTLRRGEGNHSVMVGAEGVYLEDVTISGFQMWSLHGGYPAVLATGNDGHVVNCELYEVPAIEQLDWLEGYDEASPGSGLYNRQIVVLPQCEAYIYTFNHSVSGEIIQDWKEFKNATNY